MHNLWIPVVAILTVAGLIFGSLAYSEAQRDAHIAASISERLNNQTPAEISHLARVNKGYGVCGDYALSRAESGHFFYNSATKRLALGTDDPLYQDARAPLTETWKLHSYPRLFRNKIHLLITAPDKVDDHLRD
ncbi:hypothetical protein AAGW18_20625 [Vreelandella titanicae]|uniref:hypothetical protein n=1 Tax=Vreelandella titanicae TaxID=664683 RepID=UPI00241FC870|nr:hypothetical protein [Halomonas titanicae]